MESLFNFKNVDPDTATHIWVSGLGGMGIIRSRVSGGRV